MKIVVVSGKGGTGKTTLTGALASIMDSEIIKVDCDVDASNLGLLLNGEVEVSQSFVGSKEAEVTESCIGCGHCVDYCKYKALELVDDSLNVLPFKCEGCGVCTLVCNNGGIILSEEVTGKIMMSNTQMGLLTHAALLPGADGSGKMVTAVRKIAEEQGKHHLIDGSPGVGCAVMASVTNCDLGIMVTEPTMSGMEDLKRLHHLMKSFEIPTKLVINKYDLNLELSNALKDYADEHGIDHLGNVPFDPMVQDAINHGKTIMAYSDSPAKDSIEKIYDSLTHFLL